MAVRRLVRVGNLVAVVALVAASACGDDGGSSDTDAGADGGADVVTVHVGALDSLTGPAAFCGENEVEGMRLALQEAEEQDFLPGMTVELEVADDASTAEGGVAGYRRLVSDGVAAILGPCFSVATEAIVDLTDADEVPVLLTTSGDPGFVEPDYVYSAGVAQQYFVASTVDALAARGIETVAVAYHNDTPSIVAIWEDIMKPALDDAGIEILREDALAASQQDFSAQISAYRDLDPDAIGVLMVGGPNVSFVTQLRGAGMDQPIMGQLAMAAPFYIENAGEAADGSIFATNFHPDMPQESTQAFSEAWRAGHDTDPDFAAANGYDAAWMFLHALKDAGSADPAAIQTALQELTGMTGAQGDITFDEQGGARAAGAVVEIVDGQVDIVDG